MFAHVTLRVADLGAAERCYATVLAPLGLDTARTDGQPSWGELRLAPVEEGETPTRGLHLGVVAPSQAAVDAFWEAGVEAGLRSDGAPGRRPVYRDDYYGAFLLDPDGNSAEAVRHGALRGDGVVDHLWVRVEDLAASRAFYDALAPAAGLRRVFAAPERIRYAGPGDGGGSFTLVAGEPVTAGLHVGFPARERATVLDPDGNCVELVV
jgi:catechol 2,3-dioxygenase-like lactoylglutathione lyase family enzyme